MAIITDYFNPYETKLLNGPNLPMVEDDNPTGYNFSGRISGTGRLT